ncbi:MAG: hypothetical protein ACOYK8_00750 [Alphaproteobacteria bacterium]
MAREENYAEFGADEVRWFSKRFSENHGLLMVYAAQFCNQENISITPENIRALRETLLPEISAIAEVDVMLAGLHRFNPSGYHQYRPHAFIQDYAHTLAVSPGLQAVFREIATQEKFPEPVEAAIWAQEITKDWDGTSTRLLLVDRVGSMTPFDWIADAAIKNAQHIMGDKLKIGYFFNVIYEHVHKNSHLTAPVKKNDLFNNDIDTAIVMSDSGAARGFREPRRIQGMAQMFMELNNVTGKEVLLLNPMPQERWLGSSMEIIQYFDKRYSEKVDGRVVVESLSDCYQQALSLGHFTPINRTSPAAIKLKM